MSLLLSRRGILGQIVSALPITFVNAQSARTVGNPIVTKPTGMADGDVMLCLAFNGSNVSTTMPAGWVQINSDFTTIVGGNASFALFYKVVTNAAGEPADYTVSFSSAGAAGAVIVAYRGVDTNNPIGISNFTETSAINVTAPSITTVRDNSMIVCLFGSESSVALGDPAGLTLRHETAAAASPMLQVGDVIQTAAGATSSYAASGSNSYNVGYTVALNQKALDSPYFVAKEQNTRDGLANISIDKPVGTVDGDVMIAVVVVDSQTVTPPAGWTTLQQEIGNPSFNVYAKTASGEGAFYTFTHAAQDSAGCILTYRNSSGVNVSADLYVGNSGLTIDVPDTTSTVAQGLAVHIASQFGNAGQTFFSTGIGHPRVEIEAVTNVNVIIAVADELLGAAGTVTGRDRIMNNAKTARYGAVVVLAP